MALAAIQPAEAAIRGCCQSSSVVFLAVAVIEVEGRSNTLIITDVKENIEAIRQLVAILDQPEPQVEIETRIVIAQRNFSRDLGAQLSAGRGGSRNAVAWVTSRRCPRPVRPVARAADGLVAAAELAAAVQRH